MSKLSKGAFAVMAMCEETKKPFGITVDPRGRDYAFVWAFKINPDQAKREGYDKTHVHGAIVYDKDYNGCPYCGAYSFYICNHCGKIICHHGQEEVTCPNCGSSGRVEIAETFDLRGGGV